MANSVNDRGHVIHMDLNVGGYNHFISSVKVWDEQLSLFFNLTSDYLNGLYSNLKNLQHKDQAQLVRSRLLMVYFYKLKVRFGRKFMSKLPKDPVVEKDFNKWAKVGKKFWEILNNLQVKGNIMCLPRSFSDKK
jgi:hypothetical protein